ncbi:MAG TPA: hypothetical protein VNK52_17215, partial [Hyphomicrobiaceae bacterium]|nr:hypothetical protein [Hyphomicrobiaceae bacterium]
GTAAAGPAARAETPAAPAVNRGTREFILATVWPLDTPVYGDSVLRLTRRIEAATEGRYRITPASVSRSGLAAVLQGADLYHGSEHFHLETEPALAYFAAIPGRLGLDARSFEAWLISGGGQLLWDDLAAGFGIKPLLAGHTGPSVGLWLKQAISDETGFTGLRLSVFGLAGQVLTALGGEPHALSPTELTDALAEHRIDGAEWAGPMASLVLGLYRHARRLSGATFHPAGCAYSLGIRRDLWEAFSSSDRAIFEACAAEEVRISLAEAIAHRRIAWKLLSELHSVPIERRRAWWTPALDRAAEDAVGEVAASSAKAARIDHSYRAFAAQVRDHRRMPWAGPIA